MRAGSAASPALGRPRLPLNALRAFEAVARRESFTAGAQALNVTQGALSRQVAALEALLQRRLLLRKSHGVRLTPEGGELLAAVTDALDAIEGALNRTILGPAERDRPVRLRLPPAFLRRLGAPLLKDLKRAFPDVALDFTSEAQTAAALHAYDIAVVYGRADAAEPGRDLLWRSRLTLICAPELAASAQATPLADFLADIELLHVRHEGRGPREQWELFAARNDLDVDAARGVMFDTAELAAQYAVAVGGVALVDEGCLVEEIASRRLVRLYEASCVDDYGYFLAYQPAALENPFILRLRDWLLALEPDAACAAPRRP